MEKNKYNSIYSLTDELHNDITDIYEAMMDDEFDIAVKLIEITRGKLKDLKDNIFKDE
jgi:hypothetical protein